MYESQTSMKTWISYSIAELWDETLNWQKFNAVFDATYSVAKKALKIEACITCLSHNIIIMS